uniref:non-specific serine/threonine protein kinase n=1 Tax=Zea mays TaxID=4577 RepID=A0A804QFK3_MAIZE
MRRAWTPADERAATTTSEHRRRRRMGKYEMGRTLGEGHFGKVRLARDAGTGRSFAIKILDRQRILAMKIDEQIKREIATLKLLKHPNVVRLYEPENVLVDAKGNIKVSDFGLSALPQNQRKDGLLHTTCGSPNYIAPEVLLNKGYDGSVSDVWSCGVILYVMLTGSLPFDDQNMVVLYQKILKGNAHIPKWLSQGAQDLLRKILDPNPITRVDVDGIRAHDWFKQGYAPSAPFNDDEEDINVDEEDSLNMTENGIQDKIAINQINAFQLIGMSSCLDLSGFFEKEDASERKIRFASNYPPAYLFEKIESIVRKMGFQVHKSNGKVFEINESLYVVELKKSSGDCSLYRKLCETLSEDLGTCKSQQFLKQDSIRQEIGRHNSSF